MRGNWRRENCISRRGRPRTLTLKVGCVDGGGGNEIPINCNPKGFVGVPNTRYNSRSVLPAFCSILNPAHCGEDRMAQGNGAGRAGQVCQSTLISTAFSRPAVSYAQTMDNRVSVVGHRRARVSQISIHSPYFDTPYPYVSMEYLQRPIFYHNHPPISPTASTGYEYCWDCFEMRFV